MRLLCNLVNHSVLWDILVHLTLTAVSLSFITRSVSGLDLSRRGSGTTTYNKPNRYGGDASRKHKIKVTVAVVLPRHSFILLSSLSNR